MNGCEVMPCDAFVVSTLLRRCRVPGGDEVVMVLRLKLCPFCFRGTAGSWVLNSFCSRDGDSSDEHIKFT